MARSCTPSLGTGVQLPYIRANRDLLSILLFRESCNLSRAAQAIVPVSDIGDLLKVYLRAMLPSTDRTYAVTGPKVSTGST
jgi:hypothetical protein